jgi:hypothetical protein
METWAERLLAAGFRPFDVIRDLDSDLCVTQVENGDSHPVRGRHKRENGTLPWSVYVAPDRATLDATLPGPAPAA